MQVYVGNNNLDVIVERKDNKNLYIRIKDDLKVYVTCNYLTTEKMILKVINDNQKSLIKMYNHQVKMKENEQFYYYLGDKYTLIIDKNIKNYCLEDDFIIVKDEKMITKFYKDSCVKIFTERLNKCAISFQNIPSFKLRIRKMTTRWGVCNRGNNTITLNSELIKKELTLIDYVCLHELSHFLEANHSAKFWVEVAKRYPYYKEARKMLREA